MAGPTVPNGRQGPAVVAPRGSLGLAAMGSQSRRDSTPVRPDRFRQQIPMPPGARVGPGAPWAEHVDGTRSVSLDRIRGVFDEIGPPVASPFEHGGSRLPAAVLAPIFERNGEAWIVLTRRTMSLRAHRGEVSFPGGRAEPGETSEATARRETREEIALNDGIEVVGELDHLSTVTSGSFIVPFVGVLDAEPTELVANPGEVDAILTVRLGTLLDPARFRSEMWPMPDGSDHAIFFFDLAEDTVWGATAAMLRQLLGFVTGTVARGELAHV